MAKPWIHSLSSAKRFGGDPSEYLAIHDFLDSYKGAVSDARGRIATHNAWFVREVIERVFGHNFTNSAGRVVSTREVAEMHVAEDYHGKFIPTLQDWIEAMPMKEWMIAGRGEPPPSFRKLEEAKTVKRIDWSKD